MSCHFYHKHNSLMPLPSTVAKQQCVCERLSAQKQKFVGLCTCIKRIHLCSKSVDFERLACNKCMLDWAEHGKLCIAGSLHSSTLPKSVHGSYLCF